MLDLTKTSVEVARQLIGCELLMVDEYGRRGGTIIETEAYRQDDPASHSHLGPNVRNAAMFMQPGTLYVYRIYGLHYCMNIVCGNHDGQGVLLRALKPTEGITFMKERRGVDDAQKLCNGPANLFVALGLEPSLNKQHITKTPLILSDAITRPQVASGPRIGISKAVDQPWRFWLA